MRAWSSATAPSSASRQQRSRARPRRTGGPASVVPAVSAPSTSLPGRIGAAPPARRPSPTGCRDRLAKVGVVVDEQRLAGRITSPAMPSSTPKRRPIRSCRHAVAGDHDRTSAGRTRRAAATIARSTRMMLQACAGEARQARRRRDGRGSTATTTSSIASARLAVLARGWRWRTPSRAHERARRAGPRPGGRATTRTTAARRARPGPRGRRPPRRLRRKSAGMHGFYPARAGQPSDIRPRPSSSSVAGALGGRANRAILRARSAGSTCRTTDLDGATAFYEGLLGWDHVDTPIGDDAVYRMFQLRGKNVAAGVAAAGRGALARHPAALEQLRDGGVRRRHAPARVNELGGNVMVDPFDVFDSGRMTVFTDPDRRGAVRVGAARQHRRGARQRPRLPHVERAVDHRRRPGEELLRRPVRLELRGRRHGRDAVHDDPQRRPDERRHPPAGRPGEADGRAAQLDAVLHVGRHRAERRRRSASSAAP